MKGSGPVPDPSFPVILLLGVIETKCFKVLWYVYSSKVPDHNGISRLYNMLEIYLSCPEPSSCVIAITSSFLQVRGEQEDWCLGASEFPS